MATNVIQLIGDFLHLLSFIIIIYKIHRDKSCSGISAKTQEIYLLVFCTRYLDLFKYFISYYNTIMKILFIGVTIYILILTHLKSPYKNSYDRAKEDIFPHYFLIPFAIIMSLLIHKKWALWELTWGFSLWLESVAVFPQLTILSNNGRVESFIAHYLAALGSYRLFYIFLWIYRYIYFKQFSWVAVLSGTLQVLLYADFFYLYFKNVKAKLSSELPISKATIIDGEKKNIF